jgi:hypothetical protein
VAVFPIQRREFLAAHFRKPNPFGVVLAHVEAGSDDFPFEKQAQEIENRLAAMLHGEELPLAVGFPGTPRPRRYIRIAEGVSEAEFGDGEAFEPAVAEWIRSLGRVRRARFFTLPDDMVRYEINEARTIQ